MRRPQLLILSIYVLALAVGCGAKESSDAEDSGSSDVKTVRVRDPNRPVTRTDATPLAAETGCYKQDPDEDESCKIALRMFELTNVKRKGEGKSQLKHHAGWHLAARGWSEGQAKVDKISHDGFPDSRIEQYEKEFGNDGEPEIGAENVGVARLPGATAEDIAVGIVDGWYKSPGHYKNMMGDYEYIGVGVFKDEGTGKYFVTQIFARPPL